MTEIPTNVRKRRFLLTALLAAGTAALLVALMRRGQRIAAPSYARPSGGEREGDFELFIGS
jgi:hypothetical protein